jgi:hypothetical protein
MLLSAVHVRLAYTPRDEAAATRELSVALTLIMEPKCGLGRGGPCHLVGLLSACC